MLCLMTQSPPASRVSAAPPARPHDDERQRQAFQQWLTAPPRPDNLAFDDAPPSQQAHLALVLALAPYQRPLEQLGQFSHSSLSLRLLNGPLAGLEICATAQGCALHLLVRLPNRVRFEEIAGACRTLESALARQFNRPVTLEVDDAPTATE
jgi:hypothetical protein